MVSTVLVLIPPHTKHMVRRSDCGPRVLFEPHTLKYSTAALGNQDRSDFLDSAPEPVVSKAGLRDYNVVVVFVLSSKNRGVYGFV